MRPHKNVRITLASAVFGALVAGNVLAQTPAPAAAAPTPPPPIHTLTANVGLFSNYIFRGITQTAGKPAVQGGFDYSHASGFYLGTWASNITWPEDFGAYHRASMEWDFYGGFKNNFPGSDDWSYDVGTLYYYYPGTRNPGVTNIDSWEIYGAINWKWAGAKVSYNLKDYFGAQPRGQKTDGTTYVDLYANYPVGDSGFTLLGHFGVLTVIHDGSDGDLSTAGKVAYNDWKLGASYTVPDGWLKNVEIGAYYTGNDAKSRFYTDLYGYNTAKDAGVVYVKKTF
jgi:uncharacterized protein (TIGR02001 family)